ncbi:hypothetical protein MalM25_28830 [Planctomycetes bacterium MalM25]|nr:hypothetical protein MalM25_28830 [Planctomycetes bacterium MalM25]
MADRPAEAPNPKLTAARRRERVSQAAWRRRRAELARAVAATEDRAAVSLLAQAGVEASELPSEPAAEVQETAKVVTAPADVIPAKPAPHESKAATPVLRKAVSPSTPRSKKIAQGQVAPSAKPIATERKSAANKKPQPRPLKRRIKRRRSKTWNEWFQDRPPWATSLAVHSALILLFGLLSFGTMGEPAFLLNAAMAEEDSFEELSAEVTLAEFPLDAEEPIDSPLDLSTAVELASLVEPVDLEPMAELGATLALPAEALMAAVPAGGTKSEGEGESTEPAASKPAGKPGVVSFFGAKSHANRVVFVVDNSGSMQHGRLQTTLLELGAAVRRLSTSQEFYVVFFSDQAYPMFFPESVDQPLQATQENKRALSKWLRTVEMCLGGRLLDAMEYAAAMEPDVVFLLTDGDIRSPRTIERMTAPDAWGFPIHTLGMGARTLQHGQILKSIAEASGGTARPVIADPRVVAKARARPVRYHRTQGVTWGSAVQPWK